MNNVDFNKYKSWFLSGGMIIVVALWLISGQFGAEDESELLSDTALNAPHASKNADMSGVLSGSGTRTRTGDLRIMIPPL